MINTVGASTSVNGVYNKDPQTPIHFTISLDDLVPSDYNGSLEDYLRHNITLDYIPITVYWNTNGAGRAAAVLAAGNVTTDENGNVIGMTAPHKIKVPLGTSWPAERRNIQEGYPDFPDYVSTMEEPWDNKESFYLYEYNWNLLAHRDMDRTNNYFFYDSQEEILDEIFLHGWYNSEDYQYPVDLGDNFNKNVVIKPENLFYNGGLAAGDVIRLYCTKKNSGGDFSLKVFGGHWESTVPIAGWSQDYWNGNTAGTMISEAAKTVFNNNGYIEIPVTNENVIIFTKVTGDGSAIILQGKNLTLTGISIKKP